MEFFRKFLLSSVIIFVKPGSNVQILCAMFICIVFLCLNSLAAPYGEAGDDRMQFTSLFSLVLTLLLGIGLKMQSIEKFSTWESVIFSYFMVVVNLAIFFMATYIGIIEAMDGSVEQLELAQKAASYVGSGEDEDDTTVRREK